MGSIAHQSAIFVGQLNLWAITWLWQRESYQKKYFWSVRHTKPLYGFRSWTAFVCIFIYLFIFIIRFGMTCDFK